MSAEKKTYTRFSVLQRVEHFLLILSFTTLALTGLPQKYPLSPISQWVVMVLGGIEFIRIIHRVAATVFLLESIYHLVFLGFSLYVRRRKATMLPGVKDLQDAIQVFLYNLGFAKEHPKMDRYNFVEKAEYWAMAWGLIVMAVTGFMLWNPIATTNILPGQFIPAAKVAHGGEAVLAVLAIILWHFYSVHLKRFNTSMFTGKMDRAAMEEEHGLELERIETGKIAPLPPPQMQRQRLQVFAPVAAVLTLAMLAGVYYFVTFEKSSITTLPEPQQQAKVFVQPTATQTPTAAPTATPAPTQEGQAQQGGASAVGWTGDLDAVFKSRCSACHGSAGGFKAESYADVMKAVTPGNADGSLLYTVQAGGGHPGKFTDDELARVKQWIDAGAPEQGSGGAAGGQGTGAIAAALTWEGSVQGILRENCALCHGTAGGFSVKTYADVMKQVKAGDPDGSKLMEVQKLAHPGKLNEQELKQVTDWILAGAPEK